MTDYSTISALDPTATDPIKKQAKHKFDSKYVNTKD